MLLKEKVLKTLEQMPDKFSLDELMDKVLLLEKIEDSLRQIDKGEVTTHEEVKKQAKAWQK
jgi:predicted transcriptional regulator